MSAVTAFHTVGDIIGAVIRDAKESSTTLGLVDQLIRYCNEGQEQIYLRKKRWFSLGKKYVETVAVFTPSSGLSVASGSVNVTFLSGTAPNSSGNHLYLKVNGNEEVYPITCSATSSLGTLAYGYHGETSTSATGFVYQEGFQLASEIEAVYQVTHGLLHCPLQQLGPEEFYGLTAKDPSMYGTPEFYTVYDVETSAGEWKQSFHYYPSSNEVITLNLFTREQLQAELTLVTDTPSLPFQYRQALYHYTMMKLYDFHRNDSQKAFYAQSFQNYLDKIDAEFYPTQDVARLVVKYARPNRRTLYGRYFDSRMRESP